MCLYVTFPPDLKNGTMTVITSVSRDWDSPAAQGCDRHTWGDPSAGRYLQYQPPSMLWAPRDITALIANDRNRDHDGRSAMSCRRRPHIRSHHPTHMLVCLRSQMWEEEHTREWKMQPEEDGVHFSFRHTPHCSAYCSS